MHAAVVAEMQDYGETARVNEAICNINAKTQK